MTETVTFDRVIPILRIFNLAKANEFYLEYLGFQVDWDHREPAKRAFSARIDAASSAVIELAITIGQADIQSP